jgi:hypothetical protein
MELLDLPLDVFQEMLQHVILTLGLDQALRLRLVCRRLPEYRLHASCAHVF